MTVCTDDIRSFWLDRVRQFGPAARTTLNEQPLRELEIRAMMRRIARSRPARVLDVGCGNGYSTKLFARRFPGTQFTGIDFLPEMIASTGDDVPANCTFQVGDVLDPSSLPRGPFDLVITQRCIQNLPGDANQRKGVETLLALRAPGGRLLLMECTRNGLRALNRIRGRLGRPALEDVEPWHNRFLYEGRMKRRFGARVEHFTSTYMLLAKALLPNRWCARFAWRLPSIGRFGYARLFVIE